MIPKFRAWDKSNSEMLKVECINWYLGEIVCYPEDSFAFSMELKDVELMQSTGLFDKNGVEIFEGDIVDVGTRIPFLNKIQKDEETNYLKLVPIDKRWSESYFTSFEDKSRFEILGNIYENPELLEATDD